MTRLIHLAYRFAARGFRLYARLFHPRVWGAAVLVRRGDALLLIRTSYQSWHGVPGGRRKRSEPAAEAAARELFEEVGLRAAPAELRLLREFVCHHSDIEDHVSLFELRVDDAQLALAPDGREVVWLGFVPERDVLALHVWPPLRAFLEG